MLHLTWAVHDAIRKGLGARRSFFNDLRVLTRYMHFPGWEVMIAFVAE